MPDTTPSRRSPADLLDRLKELLQDMHWTRFEAMVPLMVGRMIEVRLIAARTGYQDGADAGTAGRGGRRLRVEAKRYTSAFDARDIIGGFRQAIARDPALECWVACATRDIPEQLANALEAEGANAGVPVMTIAWDDDRAPLLAALCTQDPAIVTEYGGEEAGNIAQALTEDLNDAREYLSRELEVWRIGFEQLREDSHRELQEMWVSKRAAKARFGQDIAAGDGRHLVERTSTSTALHRWWDRRAVCDAPVVVVGQGGVGKTWASLAWIMANLEALPIVITIPAGSVTAATSATAEGLLRLIGERLATVTGARDTEHWSSRIKRILARPEDEGPSLCILFDGINQNDRVPWLPIMALLQDRPFAGVARSIVTTRPQHFERQLSRMRSLVEVPEVTTVERFDVSPGGELDEMLAAHRLSREDLHPDLIEYARIPRLFDLVVRLRDRLTDAGRVTTHRLLWEYGRDAQGVRSGSSFSEAEWQEWLGTIARNERDGLRNYTLADLGATASRPDLEPSDVAARLSDIVDGNFTTPGPGGTVQLAPEIVSHALGAALLEMLDEVARSGGSVEGELDEWLDPIDGMEERAEVLRAATSIMAERDIPAAPEAAAAIVTAWLQTQNLPPLHLAEIHRLAPRQVQPLLDTIERSVAGPQASARALAVDALRNMDYDPVAYGLKVATFTRWFSRVSRDVSPRREGFEGAEEARSRRIRDRIGKDESGPITFLGRDLILQDRPADELLSAAVSILDGHPLAGATEAFGRAAIGMAIRGRQGIWEDLKWLCLLNEVDPEDTAARLRLLSSEIAQRTTETAVRPELAGRVAALVLWLIGEESDDDAAYAIDPGIDRQLNYTEDYLANPGTSWLRLERRHAAAVLEDRSIPLRVRVDRASEFLIDPTFEVPEALTTELAVVADGFDVTQLDTGRSTTQTDHAFEQLEVAFARCVPEALANLHRRRMASYSARSRDEFDSSAWSAADAILLVDDESKAACHSLRERSMKAGGGFNQSSEGDLLLIEILDLPGTEQITAILDIEPEHISIDFADVLRPVSAEDVDALVRETSDADEARQSNLVCLLSATPLQGLSEESRSWLESRAMDLLRRARGCAFDILSHVDPQRFGTHLLEIGWNWEAEEEDICRHHGSIAVAAAGEALPFEEVASRIAPSLLARTVRDRGGAPAEARVAAAILDEAIMRPTLETPELGSTITVNSERRVEYPMSVSITPGPMPGDEENPFSGLARSPEERRDHSQRAVETALDRIRQARASGASLYLSSIKASDLHPIISSAPEVVDGWLEGCTDRSKGFRRRVHLAEGLYIALCEALLATDPEKGAELWGALSESMISRYVGQGGVDERILMLFRADRAPATERLRSALLDLDSAVSDERLLEIALAAIANGHEAWLSDAIDSDARSDVSWRRRRAIMLSGFQTNAQMPVESAILEGEGHPAIDERRAASGRRLSCDAAARHWWGQFVSAESEVSAFAAWTLFRKTADRRALVWLGQEQWPNPDADMLSRRKFLQFALNEDALVKEANRKEKDGSRKLFDRSVTRHVRPWYRAGDTD